MVHFKITNSPQKSTQFSPFLFCRAITMSNTNDKAEEVLNKGRASKTSQHWGHDSLEDDEVLGAHWDSSSRRKKESKKECV